MATPFRTPIDVLVRANEAFIQSIQNREALKKTIPIIAPGLERLWKEKVSDDPEELPNFEHYLYNYTPQLLKRAIITTAKDTRNHPVSYFKSVVQDVRRKQIAAEERKAKAV